MEKSNLEKWIVRLGLTAYAFLPGGSIVLILLSLFMPHLFEREIVKIWKVTKTFFKKIKIIKR